MTREEAYEEALRRIGEAEKTGAVELDLSGMGSAHEMDKMPSSAFFPFRVLTPRRSP